MKKILYIRSGPYQVDPKSYNLQEIGLAESFYRHGIECDILYYHKKNSFNQTLQKNGTGITILWRHGIRLLRSGIYPCIFNEGVLKQYDAIICSEYSQIMSVIMSQLHDNVYIYNGPYYNLFKIPMMEFIYDRLFCNMINSNVKKVFCKTQMSMRYLEGKGIRNCIVTGVGLDIEKFEKELNITGDTQELIDRMYGHRNILFVGSIIKRKNVELVIRAFVLLKQDVKYKDVQLVLVGNGDEHYLKYCKSLIPTELECDVVWKSRLENAQTKFVYEKCDVFLLPSTQEIFGMVLLEAMYFKAPVISSNSAGAETLIEDCKNGVIIRNFESKNWSEAIASLLLDEQRAKRYGEEAHKTISEKFMWNDIVKLMIKEMQMDE